MTRTTRRRVLTAASVGTAVAFLIGVLLAGTAVTGRAAAQTAPANTNPPVIAGIPAINEILSASNGAWTGTDPLTFTYAWQRCNETGGSCAVVVGATGQTYSLGTADVGSTMRVVVTATNTDGSAGSTSVPTAVVQRNIQPGTGCPPVQQAGPIPVSEIVPPARLLVDRKTITPRVVTRSTQRLRFHVIACDARTIRGALVYAMPTPYQQFAATETTTGADGWATLTMRRLRFFPVSGRQQLLVVFVRARKPGEDLLGGISSRRLVSFPVRLSG